ncbi:hypothetical protein [Taibaiella soli]|uniref:Uncharacterized protein n=1 Tax=Taibaiella soli TaxID=1649169 RepID=A0A2W2BKM0_9BACT|nr:hypothetical protein [Taibaiella soli]PZF74016.1 hypothetical protein DN068_04785 [Taibaiella soli]
MKKIALLIIAACCIFTAYCGIPKAYRKYFVNCCNAGKTTIRERLDIDGYFTCQIISGGLPLNVNIIFYDNGVCVESWGGATRPTPSEELNDVIKKGSKSYFYHDCNWGFYELKGDTLLSRTIQRSSIMRPDAIFSETYYKIKSRTSIVRLNMREGKEEETRNFLPHPLPNSDYSWIKKRKCKPCDNLKLPAQTEYE